MQKFSADAFFRIAKYLADVRSRLEKLQPDKEMEPGRLSEGSSGHKIMTAIKTLCTGIGLTVSSKAIQYILDNEVETPRKAIEQIAQVERTIMWEMEDRLFMYIPPERAKRYEMAEPFGSDVAMNFPSSAFDSKEAGNCFASGRFTACVFHLMRVLESGLVSFAKLFPGVPTEKENWQQIIEKIESEIREMPKAANKAADWKHNQEKYSQLANNFMFFKDAWRNYTAHIRGKYTEDEADAIYRNVSTFMQGLARLGLAEFTGYLSDMVR